MDIIWFLTLAVVTVAAVMACAVWRPGPLQWVLLLAGPVLTVASLSSGVSGGLGLAVVAVVPHLYLLVAAAVPWRRSWARWAVPATALFWCVVLLAGGRSGLTAPLVLVAAVLAVVAIAREAVRRQVRAAAAREQAPAQPGAPDGLDVRRGPFLRGAVVAAAVVQCLAGVGLAALGLLVVAWERRSSDTGPWAGLGELMGLALVVLGVVVLGLFGALAVGLRRRYRDLRFTFVGGQAALGLVLVSYVRSPWVVAAAAWLALTVGAALAAPPPPSEDASGAPDASGPARVAGLPDASSTR